MADFDPMEYDPLDLAYAAGIIDGEGYIGITSHKAKPPRSRTPYFVVRVSVMQTELTVPAWLAETFGGSLHSYEPYHYQKKGSHHWRLAGPTAVGFCRLILPYLRLKAPQAELVIRYRDDARLNHVRRGHPGLVVPEAELALKAAYAAEVSGMNDRKGRRKP